MFEFRTDVVVTVTVLRNDLGRGGAQGYLEQNNFFAFLRQKCPRVRLSIERHAIE